jgi:hypothetical protein
MYKEKKRKYKAHDNMEHIIEKQSAYIKYIVCDNIREHHCNPGEDQQGHPEIHGNDVSEFLKRIKFLLFTDGEGVLLLPEYAYCIENKLLPQVGGKVFPPFSVVFAIPGHDVPDDKNAVIESHNDCSHIVDPHRDIKTDQAVIRIAEMKTDPRKDQQQEHQGIDHVPDPDPYRIQVYFCGSHVICFSV